MAGILSSLFGSGNAQPAAPMSDAEKLAQVMSGNLKGTLSSGDKLLALSALLGSVKRGSQTTPQQALANIQQQKMNEIQGRLQIEQMKRAAAEKAQLDVAWNNYVNSIADPQAKAAAMATPSEKRADVLAEFQKYRKPDVSSLGQQLIDAGLIPGTPEFQAAIRQALAQPRTTQVGNQIVTSPGITIGRTVTPEAAIAELKKRGVIK